MTARPQRSATLVFTQAVLALQALAALFAVLVLWGLTRAGELDLRREAASASELADAMRGFPGYCVPSVDWDRTNGRAMTIEWIDGIKLNDLEALRASHHDLKAIAANLVQSFLRHTLRDGFFHADPHPGNILLRGDSSVAFVDFGIFGELTDSQREIFTHYIGNAALGRQLGFGSN